MSSDFEIVVFLGHADDANAAADVVLETEKELQSRLDSYCRVARIDPPLRFRFFEWRRDAPSVVGGQRAAIGPTLDRAHAAFFLFRDRVGTVTWQELESLRQKRIPIVALFPDHLSGNQRDKEIIGAWSDLLERKESLTRYWTEEEGKSITPVADYENDGDIRKIALDRLNRILETLAAERNAPPKPPGKPNAPEVDLKGYLEGVLSETDHIKITGIGTDAGSVKSAGRYPIERLYTPLKSRGGDRTLEGEKEIDLSELLSRYNRLVIEGQPGSGKSTFLKFVASMLARDGLGKPCPEGPSWSERYLGSEPREKRPVPIWIRFSELVLLLEKKGGPRRDNRQWLLDYLEHLCNESRYPCPRHHWEALLEEGNAVLLLDGLDEISDEKLRERVYKILKDGASHWNESPIVLTSRPIETATLREMGFHLSTIEPFREKEIHRFLDSWVHALHDKKLDESLPATAVDYRDELLKAIDRPRIRQIATNPVMLTCLCVVHWNEGKLPEGRSRVYRAVLRWLIRARAELREAAGYNERFAWRAFALLALTMMGGDKGKRAMMDLIDAAEAIDPIVAREFQGKDEQDRRDIAKNWLEFECLGSGIVEKLTGNRVRFWHLTFQEFLAALQLAWLGDGEDAKEDWWPTLQEHLDSTQWRETVELFPACLLDEGGEGRVDKLFSRVLAQLEPGTSLPRAARTAGIVGRLLQPLTVYGYRPKPEIDKTYKTALHWTLDIFTAAGAAEVGVQGRIAAAEALGRGGDPRFLQGKENLIEVPGTGGVRLGKYPVTVEEFQRFVEHPGYETREFWDDDGWSLREKERWTAPEEWETQLQTPNRPVVNVSWHEANAYCRWMSEQWGEAVRLPSNTEWESAATSRDGDYPWGKEEPHEELANFAPDFSPNVGAPTPVGLYPAGNGPYYHCDLAGNVYEWSSDKDHDGMPFLRGGSWVYPAERLRSSSRSRSVAWRRGGSFGFRVAVAPRAR